MEAFEGLLPFGNEIGARHFRDFLNPKAKEAFFVRSFTRRVKNEAAKRWAHKASYGGGVRSLPAHSFGHLE